MTTQRTYDLEVMSVDNRGRVRFEQAEPVEGKPPANVGDPRLTIVFGDAKHGYTPGARVKLTLTLEG